MTVPSPADPPPGAAAEELAAIRRRVLNVVGHELRTPVTTIHGLAESICAAEDLSVVTAELGPALLRNAQRLTGLLDDLLVASGIETAVPVGAGDTIDLAALVTERWGLLGQGPVDVTGPAATVTASRDLLVRALDPVLANAAQYGTAAPRITIAVTDTGDAEVGDGVAVAVHSPGPPLHPEEVRLAPEAFFRGEVAVTTRPGLGVGLAIARAALGHLGGGLVVEAEEDGLVTILQLPTENRT